MHSISLFAQGYGDILSRPTLYVAKYLNLQVLQGAQKGVLATARHDNGELYEKALAELGRR